MKARTWTCRALAVALVSGSIWSGPEDAVRHQKIRLSYKIIVDGDGNPPMDTSVDKIEDIVDMMNTKMEEYGRGYRFVLADSISLIGGPASAWFNTDFVSADSGSFSEFRLEAFGDPAYLWNPAALNVYVNAGTNGGVCKTPISLACVVAGSAMLWDTHLHEVGHWFSLAHTHGPTNCPGPDQPQSDFVADTLPDLPLWNQDDIAQQSFGSPYAGLTSEQARRVNDTFENVMSYRGTTCGAAGATVELTDGQLDRWEDSVHLFESRAAVRSGRIYFVAVQGNSWNPQDAGAPPLGSSTRPLYLGSALNGPISASGRDQLVLRPGVYTWNPGVIDQPVTLRATRSGPVTLRK